MAVVLLVAPRCAAQGNARECGPRITRGTVARCAVAASFSSRAAHQGIAAAEGRAVAASPVLPSNPVVELTLSRRSTGGQQVANWGVLVGQEIEIAGQRGARRTAAAAGVDVQRSEAAITDRDAAVQAWLSYFDAAATDTEVQLAQRLEAGARAVAVAVRARADRGLVATVDADVADASAMRARQVRLSAQQRSAALKAELAGRLGLDPLGVEITLDADLSPIAGVDEAAHGAARRTSDMPEVRAFEAERRAQEARASMYRRSRVPNPTISAFVQNDDINERILGIAVAIPLPLPQPVGRTYAGEIAEAEALSTRAGFDAERSRIEVRVRLASAIGAYRASKEAVEGYAEEALVRAERSLLAISADIEAGKLGMREALITQQNLTDLLIAHVSARRALALASVELARASGMPLESLTP